MEVACNASSHLSGHCLLEEGKEVLLLYLVESTVDVHVLCSDRGDHQNLMLKTRAAREITVLPAVHTRSSSTARCS